MLGDSLTIVAVPEVDDPTWNFSSEKVPHMTICYLGDQSKNPNLSMIHDYVEHAASLIGKFGLAVTRRGLLGDQNADVLFFEGQQTEGIRRFRSHLLANDAINKAYDSVEQFPGWTPHLTMGYPGSPAKKDDRDYPGIHWVNFDRIELWTGDYEGPIFPLKSYPGSEGGVGMSDAEKSIENTLAHFGVMGMHWGVRKDSGNAGSTRADKKWGKKASKFSTFTKVYNSASQRMNDIEISRINNKPQYKNADFTKDSPLRKKYYKEFNDTMERVVNEEALRIVGTNPSGTKRLTYHAADNGNISFKFQDVKHSDGDVEFIGKVDSEGRIISVSVKQDSMMQEDLHREALAHFGVLGMHWGVRKSDSGGGSSGPEDIVVTKKKFGSGLKATGGKGHGPNAEAVMATAAARKAQKSGLASLSNKELESLTRRMNLEQQFVRLKETEPTAFYQGQLKVKKILGYGKTLNEVHQFMNSGAGKEIQNLFKTK